MGIDRCGHRGCDGGSDSWGSSTATPVGEVAGAASKCEDEHARIWVGRIPF